MKLLRKQSLQVQNEPGYRPRVCVIAGAGRVRSRSNLKSVSKSSIKGLSWRADHLFGGSMVSPGGPFPKQGASSPLRVSDHECFRSARHRVL